MHSITKKGLCSLAIAAVFALYIPSVHAQSEPIPMMPRADVETDGGVHVSEAQHGVLRMRPASSTELMHNGEMPKNGQNATSTSPKAWHMIIMNGTSTHPMMPHAGPGVLGTVTEVNGSSIIMQSRLMNAATTTLTVNVTSATTFTKASTSASLSDIAIGSMIFVSGKISTSTDTVAATHIFLNIGMGKGDAPQGRMMGEPSHNGTTTPPQGGVMRKIQSFFGRMFGSHDASTSNDGAPSGSAAVGVTASSTSAASQGFFGNVFHSLFGWIK